MRARTSGPFGFCMRTINFKSCKFSTGTRVIVVEEYKCGDTELAEGEIGIVTGSEIHHYPDLGLFGIRLVHFDFPSCDVSMGEEIAERHMEII